MKQIKSRRSIKTIALFLVAIVALSVGAIGVWAKYISERRQEAVIQAQKFHFSSNYLKTTSVNYDVYDWAEGIQIELYNYEVENEALVTSGKIEYEVTAQGFSSIVKRGDVEINKNGTKYTFLEGKGVHSLTLIPNNENLKKGDVVTVTVTTTAPYKRELTATFTLASERSYTYEVARVTDEHGDYYKLTLLTNQFEGELDFKWDQKVLPDNTNELMRNWTKTSGSARVNKFTTYELIFFNPENEELTAESFSITEAKV